MSSCDLLLRSETFKVGNRKSLLRALRYISDADCDFNGENGIEYLRGEVWEANGYKDEEDFNDAFRLFCEADDLKKPVLKFESNQDYYIDKVKEIEDDEECIKTFLNDWLGNDNYYRKWEYDVIMNAKGNLTGVSVAALTC